ncbi:predicted protein [Lichtheimia corymbifera JMRC:FSU:9682]|uniref:Uncharacterized protein n=1 Tax=Lichtheimia corymbifera JMRC:FSU:9682 TaxID=1263082 RepID=A0A068SH26_9FUNG|nr:predicted protein [Lichtheimia corymbifera JMRC:FSU:9682]
MRDPHVALVWFLRWRKNGDVHGQLPLKLARLFLVGRSYAKSQISWTPQGPFYMGGHIAEEIEYVPSYVSLDWEEHVEMFELNDGRYKKTEWIELLDAIFFGGSKALRENQLHYHKIKMAPLVILFENATCKNQDLRKQ